MNAKLVRIANRCGLVGRSHARGFAICDIIITARIQFDYDFDVISAAIDFINTKAVAFGSGYRCKCKGVPRGIRYCAIRTSRCEDCVIGYCLVVTASPAELLRSKQQFAGM